jgi:transposase
MTRKNTLKILPIDTEYRVVGLDLAKSDVSVAAIPIDDNTPSLVERMNYADLLEWAEKISPTLFAMEPCNGFSLLCLQLESLGHEVKVISGATVSMWINTHLSGQKTDLNDAIALARLAISDAELTPIGHKTITEICIQTVQAVRQQLITQRTKSLVSFKGLAQQWGIPCCAGHRNLKKLREAVEAKVDLISKPLPNHFCHYLMRSNLLIIRSVSSIKRSKS